MKSFPLFHRLALVVVALALSAGTAVAQSPQNPIVITTAPYTITASGYYILGNNINYSGTSGNIITINSSNVTLDFNNFYIAGAVSNASQSVVGVFATERSNLTIKNGTIAYCAQGININGNSTSTTNNVGHNIVNMRITYCYQYGIYFNGDAPGSQVVNCQLSQIGGSTAGVPACIGIYGFGNGIVENGNIISTVNRPSGGAAGTSAGISNKTNSVALSNILISSDLGVLGGVYKNNVAVSVTTPYSGGTDGGGNS